MMANTAIHPEEVPAVLLVTAELLESSQPQDKTAAKAKQRHRQKSNKPPMYLLIEQKTAAYVVCLLDMLVEPDTRTEWQVCASDRERTSREEERERCGGKQCGNVMRTMEAGGRKRDRKGGMKRRKKEGKAREERREGARKVERKGRKGDDLTCRASSKFTYPDSVSQRVAGAGRTPSRPRFAVSSCGCPACQQSLQVAAGCIWHVRTPWFSIPPTLLCALDWRFSHPLPRSPSYRPFKPRFCGLSHAELMGSNMHLHTCISLTSWDLGG